ncbi:MAG: hypothetical protein RUDDFDWM_001146 [Candidatus Fervidibacterota bacterium]
MFVVFPIGTSAKLTRRPTVTLLLIGLNTIVYFLELVVFFSGGTKALQRLFEELGFIPISPKPYTLFTSMFVHDAPLPFHLFGNMLYLWIFGRYIENVLGSIIYAVFYMTSQLGAIAMQTVALKVFNTDLLFVPQVGASGAIAALLGLFVVRFYHERVKLFYIYRVIWYYDYGVTYLPSTIVLGGWFVLEIVNGVLSLTSRNASVGHWAHIGGFIVGVLAALLFGSLKEAQVESLISCAEQSIKCNMWKSAEMHLRRAIRANRRHVVARLLLSVVLAHFRRTDEARKHLQVALMESTQLNPDEEVALSECFSKLGEKLLTTILELSTPEMKFDIALLLERIGNCELAIEAFKSVASEETADEETKALAMLRCAEILLKDFNDKESALQLLNELCVRFPSSQWVTLAKHIIHKVAHE